MASERLSRDDWIKAGFRTIAADGPAALQIKILAQMLGATKGSFYWHFKDIAALKQAMLETWRTKVATEIIHAVQQCSTPHARLAMLVREAGRAAPDEFGGRAIEPAMRAWALSDPAAATMLKTIDGQRLEFLSVLMKENGITDDAAAPLFYAAYLGADDLAARRGLDPTPLLARLLATITPARR